MSSLPFRSDQIKTQVRALARLMCACVHAAWPPRSCACSPCCDVHRSSILPAHLSPISHCQSGSVRQAQLPRLAHMTNLDQAVWRRICPAPSLTCPLVSELVSSVHPAMLLPLHRHANDVRQALSHIWPTLHALTCPCVTPVLAPHALVHCIVTFGHHTYFPVPMRRLAPMHDTLHPQLDPHDAPPASHVVQHRAARMGRLYAPVHYTNAHPCLSCSIPVPRSLFVARPALPPHKLSSHVSARIPPVCR
jgi:hypothetical protein